MRGYRGFTLLELLMVVIIIGILASIALPQYLNAVERSRAAEAFQNLAALRGSEIRYQAEHNVYTATLADLDVTATASANWGSYAVNVLNQDVTVKRLTGPNATKLLYTDITTGKFCEDNSPPAWGTTTVVFGNCQ